MSVVPVQQPVSTTVPTLTLNAGAAGGVAVASTIDPVNDYTLIYTASATATQGISRNTYLGLSSQPVGINDTQTIAAKTFNNTNAYTSKDTSFTLQNASATTKQAQFLLSSITAGQTRIFTLPDYNAQLATLGGTETLTNKTLTSPTITSPTITNATISADALAGFTTANSGTVYGVSVTGGVINGANTIGNAALQTNAVQANQLATSAITLGYVQIITNVVLSGGAVRQVTGLSVTVTIPAGGRRIKITGYSSGVSTDASGNSGNALTIWDGAVGSGTQLSQSFNLATGASQTTGILVQAVVQPSSGSKTYNIGCAASSAGNPTVTAAATYPAFILVEAI